MTTQATIIEDAAQELAAWLGEDFTAINMLDHYLGRVTPLNTRAAEIAGQAADLLRPMLEQLREADIELALTNHQVASCNAELRNLTDYVRSMPDRLPKIGSAHAHGEFIAWLKREIEAAPTHKTRRQGNRP